MGTNHYLVTKKGKRVLHLGKQSAGWVYSLNVHPNLGINNLEDMIVFIAKHSKVYHIESEYNETIPLSNWIMNMKDRINGKHSDVDGWHCISAEIACDHIIGDFC